MASGIASVILLSLHDGLLQAYGCVHGNIQFFVHVSADSSTGSTFGRLNHMPGEDFFELFLQG